MLNLMRRRRTRTPAAQALAVGLTALVALGGCTTRDVDIPDLDGPSSQGFDIRLRASKDILVADGRDFATITATVIGPDGRGAANQDVFFTVADEDGVFADIGVIVGSNGPGTGATVRTNSQGVAQVLYEAPARTDATANQTVLVAARLVGTDANGANYRSVRIELRSAEPRLFPPTPGNAVPTCQFITEPGAGPWYVGEVVGFHSTSFDSDGVIIRYEWTFGDAAGSTGDEPDVAFVYRTPGTYTITHRVIDDDGGVGVCAAVNIPVVRR
jgi:hypothetical protein